MPRALLRADTGLDENWAIWRWPERGSRHSTYLGCAGTAPAALDFRRYRRGEEQRLAVSQQLRQMRLDVGDEAHVEHAVGFVDHQKIEAGEQDLAASK